MEAHDDVFSDSRPTIVDCDLLEASKENVQPLASGRRVTALSTILATPHAQRESKLSSTRNRLRINVELALDDEEGDPLEAYCRLVYWTVENYPQGPSVESGLIELLEEATRVLKDDRGGKWKGEMKYLKLWLLYASFVEKPTIIYKFLIANEIGTVHALLYEEFAAVLERDGRRKDADETYVLGIARRASPLEHLQSRYSDFQKRMMTNSLSVLPPVQPTVPARPALAAAPLTSRTGSSSRTHAPRNDTSLPSSTTHARVPSSSNRPLQIFVDPTGSESQAAEATANTWTDLGTRKTRIKENVPEVQKLVGTKIKQAGRTKRLASGSASGPSSSKIVPYRDPSPSDMPPPPAPGSKKSQDIVPRTPSKSLITPFVDGQEGTVSEGAPSTPRFTPFRDETMAPVVGAATPAPESVMKVKKDGIKAPVLASEAEALRKDPLKNYPEAGIDEND